MIAFLLPYLLRYWYIIAIAVVVASMWGVYEYRGHEVKVLTTENVKLKADYKKEHDQHAADIKEWQAEVARQEKAIAEAAQGKKEVIDTNIAKLFKQREISTKRVIDNVQAITKNIKPDATITVPSEFRRLFLDTIAAGPQASGETGGDIRVSQDSSGTLGKTETFDALTFTKVIIGNMEQYNDLALKHNTLINIVVDLEKNYAHK